ncbi:GlcG/HbpS family heme-binding protein [Usitatibacter palustris]|uniref:Heme-binding protein n=1 Tax=Usitatibacter palustris TaxID=2732487 RepID=A0A6M4H606_9PROT|nr:heme-binding protein [Usitatibacter palustris]QJR15081.1 hypothetical protein DSM104440_01897 [Usitatibacter palustris]
MRTLLVIAGFASVAAVAQPAATFSVKQLTPETALIAAKAALEKCRAEGFQVAVAVTDRAGVTQVLLRDRFAGPHTVEMATRKAYTAVSFRVSTLDFERDTQAGKPSSGVRHLSNIAAVGGGRTIEAGGALLGGIGVSGAPGGVNDDACAAAGIKAIADSLEF